MFSRRIHLLRLFLVCFLTSTFSPILFSSSAFAFADPITVTSQTDTPNFPKSIDFQVSARDANSTITQATLFIMYNSGGYQEQHVVTVTPPTKTVTLRWHEDTTGDNFSPPGTQIQYYWKLQDSANNSHTDNPQAFSVTDTRFAWQHLSQGMLQVNWYNHSQAFGQTILSQATTNITRISNNLGGGLQHLINLWIYQTADDFRGALPPQAHEWVGGIAFPTLNQASIVVDSLADDTLRRDMPHELTHLIFHQLTIQDVAPTWFDEGMAVYNQLYKEPAMTSRLKDALATKSLIPLADISGDFPADADKAYLAYAESWNLVDYMFNTFGRNKMALLIKDMNNPQTDFGQDLVLAFNVDAAHLENQWHISLNQPPTLPLDQQTPTKSASSSLVPPTTTDNALPLLLLLGGLLVILPFSGIIGLLAYQRRTHERNLMIRQTQQIINTTLPQPLSLQNHLPYTDPTKYTFPPSPSMPMAGPYPQRPVGPTYPETPIDPWGPPSRSPATFSSENGNPSERKPLPPPFTYNQEYLHRPPGKQVSQE